ncbi:MAG: N-acetyltransferase [Proteobacteria bacterium]|nr:N-acetyltransferase [Pseudomonadota bacterium]
MPDLAVTILPESADDASAIELLTARTFGPGRYAKSAYRLRECVPHLLELSFTARVGTLMVGCVRLTPIRIAQAGALLLGPLTIEPAFRARGIGLKLLQAALAAARDKGHRLVLLVGDEPYYGRVGFRRAAKGQIAMPGPVDPARVLIAELVEGAGAAARGAVTPDWDAAPGAHA